MYSLTKMNFKNLFISIFLSSILFNLIYSYKNINNIYKKVFNNLYTDLSLFPGDFIEKSNNKYLNSKFKLYCQNHIDIDNKYIIQDSNNKNSSFYLPGIFEVFPELKINFKKNNFKFKKCLNDDDCENPEMCCDNIFKELDKFCCKGASVGKSAPAYAF